MKANLGIFYETHQRQRAFEEWPYPCIGHVRFLELTTTTHPKYSEILTCLQAGQSFLDVGCCFGQDIRKLLYDGVPSSTNMYGIDIEPAFFQLGYDLFRDRNTLEATFLEADLIKSQHPLPSLEPILGKIDIISAQSLFHLFNLDDQKTVARHLISLTKPGNGAMIAGRQVGCRHAQEGSGLTAETRVFAHNVESWTQLWEEVGQQTGSRWEVQATEEEPPERLKTQKWYTPDINILVFTLFRRQ
jgi:SAM-dependent methyltransferase